MNGLAQEAKEQLEDFVNSKELEEAANSNDWSTIWEFIEKKVLDIDFPWPEFFLDVLERDLRDWWKNGNMYHWEPSESNAFGMSAWYWGDPDFWGE